MRGYSSSREGPLFHKGQWHPTQDAWRKKLVQEIESKNGDELLNTSTNDLAQHYADKFRFEVPSLHSDDLVVDQRETQVDISQDRNRMIHDRSRPYLIAGTSVDVEMPFSGDKIGFDIQPSTQNFNNPRAYVGDGVLAFSNTGTDLTAEKVKPRSNAGSNQLMCTLDGWLTTFAVTMKVFSRWLHRRLNGEKRSY